MDLLLLKKSSFREDLGGLLQKKADQQANLFFYLFFRLS